MAMDWKRASIRRTARCMAGIAGVGLTAFAPTAVFAQQDEAPVTPSAAENSNVIIVTAQRRAEAQVDVPISITNLDPAALETANVQELGDIVKVTPALRFDFAGGFYQPTIRGIGTAVTTSGGGGNVGIYIDGFYSPNPLAADFDLMSVDSIQVLKGPQGTLFGRNTTGGAILVSTREPSTSGNEFEGRASYGRFHELKGNLLANFALSDRFAVSLEGLYKRGDGWQHDIISGRRVGEYENWTVRASFKAELTDNLDVILRYKHGDVDDPSPLLAATFEDRDFGLGAPFGGVPGTYTTDRNHIAEDSVPEFFRSNSDVVQGTIHLDLDFADLTSFTQYRNEEVNASQDLDYSGLDLFQIGLPNNNETWSQELLMTSKSGSPLQWTAGLFYFQNTDQYLTYIDNNGSDPANRVRLGGSATTSESYAAFVDVTYEIVPKLFLTGGARYSKDKIVDAYWNRAFVATEVPVPDISNDKLTPRAVVRYKPTDHASIYASFTKGYKAAVSDVGGSCQSNPDPNNPGQFICNEVEPEDINAYELGFKYEKDGLSLEAAGFYYDYKNLQVSIFRTGTAEIINAATSEIYGLEGALSYRMANGFDLSAGAAWVHARYKNFNDAPIYTRCSDLGSVVQATCLASGVSFIVVPTDIEDVPMQRAPEFTAFVGARYETEVAKGDLALSGNLYYSSEFWFGPSGTQFKENGYATLALRAQWDAPSDNWYIALFGDNVTDNRYYTQAQYSSFGIGGNWSKPATYGVEFGFKY